jgi:hypothetical protein
VPRLLGQATTTLAALRDVHRDLGERLTRDVYVRHIRHYYAGAPVGGIEWQGVNAGDQAWSMALDLALGIAQTSARYLDYMRSRLPYLVPSHRELVLRELSGPGWLEEARHVVRADHTPSFRTALRALYDALVDVTWAHHDLAVQFVDDAVGTSGVEVRFLEETIRMRRDVPLLRELG